VVEPYLSTVMCARMVDLGGPDDLRREILPAVAEGAIKLAFAQTEDGARYDLDHVSTTAKPDGEGFILDGVKRVVLHAPQADRLLVSARTSGHATDRQGISLFVVDAKAAGIRMTAWRTIDELRGADIELRNVRVPAEAVVGEIGKAFELIEQGVDYGSALLCAEAVGAMKHANEATLEYLKTRKQFGVPIGTFQALQHRIVDLYIAQEQARSMACLACSKVDSAENPADRIRAVSAAKIKIADNARQVSQEAVQLHGGMGMSEELKISHSFRRLTVLAQQYGDADHHLERFASL
jgi:alkylation response protein AidB-like acyl-CoA dehydrogenase